MASTLSGADAAQHAVHGPAACHPIARLGSLYLPSSVQHTQCREPVAMAMTFFPCSPCTCRGRLTWSSDPWPNLW